MVNQIGYFVIGCFVLAPVFASAPVSLPPTYAGKGCNVNNITVMPNFDPSKYMGKWYEVGWLPVYFDTPSEAYIDYMEIYKMGSNNNIDTKTYGRVDSSYKKCNTKDKVIYYTQPAKYYYNTKNGNMSVIVDYWIIDTDYTHYSLCYGCTQKTGEICDAGHAWIWSKDEDLEQKYFDMAFARLPELCINKTDLIMTEQEKDCEKTSGAILIGQTTSFMISAVFVTLWTCKLI